MGGRWPRRDTWQSRFKDYERGWIGKKSLRYVVTMIYFRYYVTSKVTKMAMSTAERQRVYRARNIKNGTKEHISLVVEVGTKRQLERLARYYGITQVAMLERLLGNAESHVVRGLKNTTEYYDGVTE